MKTIILQLSIALIVLARISSLIIPPIFHAIALSWTIEQGLINSIVPSVLSRENLPLSVNIPRAMSKLYPLPQEEMTTSYNRGNAYLMTGKFADSLIEFNRALDISPNTADIYLSRGIVKEKLLLWDDAIADYRKANRLYKSRPFSGDDPTCFSNIANAETGLGQWEQALKDYTYAASLRGDFVAPQLGRALGLYELGEEKEASEYFKALTIKYPLFADAQAALAVIRFHDGDIDNALDSWEIALEQDSRYADIDWVKTIRRWPPKLVDDLVLFKASINSNNKK